jgi:S1-C subfamily serine protease
LWLVTVILAVFHAPDVLAGSVAIIPDAPEAVHEEFAEYRTTGYLTPHASSGGTGTGVVIDDRSHILTSYHVVEGCNGVMLRHDNLVLRAHLSRFDEKMDLAILVPERPFPAETAIFRNARTVSGERVVVAGFPGEVVGKGLLKAVSAGIASVDDPSLQQGMMRLTEGLGRGASGGPVLDRSGRVIGIVTGLLVNSRNGKPVEAPGVAVRGEAVQAFLQRSGIKFRLGVEKSASVSVIATRVARQVVMIECSGRSY